MIRVTETTINEDGSEMVKVRTSRPNGALAIMRYDYERTLRLILDILYNDRLSAEERVARAGNSPGFDPVWDGRPAFPWPARRVAPSDIPAVGPFHA